MRGLALSLGILLGGLAACTVVPSPGDDPFFMQWLPRKTEAWVADIRQAGVSEVRARAERLYEAGSEPERAYVYYALSLELDGAGGDQGESLVWLERAADTPLYWRNIRNSMTSNGYAYVDVDFSLPGLPEAQHDFAQYLIETDGDLNRARTYLERAVQAGYRPARATLERLN